MVFKHKLHKYVQNSQSAVINILRRVINNDFDIISTKLNTYKKRLLSNGSSWGSFYFRYFGPIFHQIYLYSSQVN